MDSGVSSSIGVDVQNRVVAEHNQECDSVTTLLLAMVEIAVTVKVWRRESVAKSLVPSTEDGVIMVNGVNVQHRVVMEQYQDVDLVLTLALLMAVKNALVKILRSNHVVS
jgi:hypothetical protein